MKPFKFIPQQEQFDGGADAVEYLDAAVEYLDAAGKDVIGAGALGLDVFVADQSTTIKTICSFLLIMIQNYFRKTVSDETTDAVKNHPTPSPSGWILVFTLAGAPNMGLLPVDIKRL